MDGLQARLAQLPGSALALPKSSSNTCLSPLLLTSQRKPQQPGNIPSCSITAPTFHTFLLPRNATHWLYLLNVSDYRSCASSTLQPPSTPPKHCPIHALITRQPPAAPDLHSPHKTMPSPLAVLYPCSSYLDLPSYPYLLNPNAISSGYYNRPLPGPPEPILTLLSFILHIVATVIFSK